MTICPSTIHKTAREGTVPGTFDNPHNEDAPQRVTYCPPCAEVGVMLGMFTPDPAKPKIEPAPTAQ